VPGSGSKIVLDIAIEALKECGQQKKTSLRFPATETLWFPPGRKKRARRTDFLVGSEERSFAPDGRSGYKSLIGFVLNNKTPSPRAFFVSAESKGL
jgi:hypothetical protein